MQIEQSASRDAAPENPACSSHPSSQVLYHCGVCGQFLCIVCLAEHQRKSGHCYTGSSYEEYIQERELLLERIKRDCEDKKKLYAMIQGLVEKTLEDYEATIVRKIALVERGCSQYKDALQDFKQEAQSRAEQHELKNQEERGVVFERALTEVMNGNYENNLRTVQQFYLLPLEEDRSIVGWVKEIRMTGVLSNFARSLKSMYRLFRWYQKQYAENVGRLDSKKRECLEEEKSLETSGIKPKVLRDSKQTKEQSNSDESHCQQKVERDDSQELSQNYELKTDSAQKDEHNEHNEESYQQNSDSEAKNNKK